jgi:hypothetical protein
MRILIGHVRVYVNLQLTTAAVKTVSEGGEEEEGEGVITYFNCDNDLQ